MICGNSIARFRGMMWGKITAYITFVKIKLSGKHNINKNQSYIIVANHQSNFDILAFYGWLPIDFRWVMKKEIRKAPIIGIFCEKAGHIFVDRKNTNEAIKTLQEAANKICNGTSILFFPEGTRNGEEYLMPFKKGAFKMALDLKLPILPVTIKGSKNIMPPNKIQVFPGKIEIIIHEPIDTLKYNDADSLLDATRNTIQSVL
jgi:1-acyl-sn-glycerol-3-phosphate acyltransferase